MYLSVIVPVFNEQDNLKLLYDELDDVLKRQGKEYEIIFIDDGSSDNSLSVLQHIQEQDSRTVVISFRRNFGQTSALAAGFDHATGEIIITMDADLQNDPADIPKLLDKLYQGYDLVNGWRFDRQDQFISRKLPSIIANWIISVTTQVKLHDYGCTLKAFRKEVAEQINLYGEMHRFIPAIASAMGVKIAEIKVNHRARRFGQSKYGISRTIRVVLDLIVVKFLLSYSTRPIQIFGVLGITSGLIGFLIAVCLTIQRQFFGIGLADRPMLLLAIFLIFIGLQFVSIGLMAELQARTYHETQNKPIYTIRQIYRASETPLDGQKTQSQSKKQN